MGIILVNVIGAMASQVYPIQGLYLVQCHIGRHWRYKSTIVVKAPSTIARAAALFNS